MTGWINGPLFAGIAVAAGLTVFGPAASASDGLQGWQPIAPAELATLRAGTDAEDVVIVNDVDGVSVSADGMVASNTVSAGSFAHSMGIVTNIQNNGHGAVINNAINVDLSFVPAP